MKYIILLTAIFLSSCKTKQIVSSEKSDTLIHYVDRIIEKPISIETFITEPCDSNGILKDFTQEIKMDKAVISVFSENNQIKANLSVQEDSCINEFIYKTNTVYLEKENLKFSYPKLFWWSLLLNVGFIAYFTKRLWL